MLHGILVGASEWALFTRIDASIAEAFREAGCGRCGGRLDVADYARKPRGLGFRRGEGFTRFSFCCGSEGCRRRSTPPSVRYFGSRVYASGCFPVVSALSGGCSAAAAGKLCMRLGIARRTLRRWRREAFPRTPQWISRQGGLARPPAGDALPASLRALFGVAGDRGGLLRALRWLLPWRCARDRHETTPRRAKSPPTARRGARRPPRRAPGSASWSRRPGATVLPRQDRFRKRREQRQETEDAACQGPR